jgi:O-antigen ligase
MITKNINKINSFSFVVLFSTLIWGITISIYGLLLFILLQLVLVIVNKSYKIQNLTLFLPLLIYFTIHLLSFIYSDNLNEAKRCIETKLSFIVVPLVVLGNINIKTDTKKTLKVFGFSVILYLIICEIYGLFNSVNLHETKGWIFDTVVRYNGTWGITLSQSLTRNTNYFFGKYYSFLIHASYIAMFINILKILVFERILFSGSKRLFLILVIIFLEINIFQLQSKVGLVSSFIIYFYYLYKYYINYKQKLKAIIISMILVFFVIISFLFFPRFEKIRSSLKHFKNPIETLKNTTYRYGIWESSLSVISKNFVFGTGIGDLQTELDKEYKSRNNIKALEAEYNAHNQFLQDFIALGFIGFLSLTLMFVKLFAICIKRKYNLEYFIPILVLILFNLLFESMFQRTYGIFLFVSLYCLIVITQFQHEKNF